THDTRKWLYTVWKDDRREIRRKFNDRKAADNSSEHIIQLSNNSMKKDVTSVDEQDTVPFKPEFFIQIARSFPSLKYLFVRNIRSSLWSFREFSPVDDHSCSIVEYSHLILLDIDFVTIDYVD
ncbi:unnamed protein product, partial [Rotaria sp. Silwood2]